MIVTRLSLHSQFVEGLPPSCKRHHHLPAEIIGVVIATRPTRHYTEFSSVSVRACHTEAELDGVDC